MPKLVLGRVGAIGASGANATARPRRGCAPDTNSTEPPKKFQSKRKIAKIVSESFSLY